VGKTVSIGSIGSTPSFWQQDQNYWSDAQAQSQASSADNALIDVMGQAETNLAKGLASIANKTALNRVNSEITSLVEQVLNPSGSSGSSSSGGSSGSSTPSSSSAASAASPATGTSTARVTTGTSLSTLGILPGGTITVGTGTNTTTYTSTGTDTVADLINTINVDLPTNANVIASINAGGQLVITGRDVTSAIFVGGSGNDAAAIGFGTGNNTFLPKAASSPSPSSASSKSSTGSSSSGTSASKTSSQNTPNANSKGTPTNSSPALQSISTAASILSAAGVSGNLVNMLA
jgi:hypothetical protein